MKCIDKDRLLYEGDDIKLPPEIPEFVCKKCEVARKAKGKTVVFLFQAELGPGSILRIKCPECKQYSTFGRPETAE